jgi:hypothetical protein
LQASNNNTGGSELEVEEIPDADSVSRCSYAVDGVELDPASTLQFSSQNKPPRCESAYWRKYAPHASDVAERGIRNMEPGNKRRVAKGQKPWDYAGARTGRVADLRVIRTQRGFAFTVEHVPEEGDRAHAHLTLIKVDPNGPEPNRADKSELVDALLAVMPFESYPPL